MVKDAKYIIKRILIGVGIALVLAYLKGGLILNAKAMTVNSQNLGSQTWSVYASTNYWYVNKSFNNIWYNWGPGFVYFNIAISKQDTNSVAPLVSPKSIVLSSSSSSYACSFDSSSVNNSTYINQHYSVTCPVNFSSDTGLTLLTINLLPNNNTPLDNYEIYFDGYMTFVNDSSSVNVNVDNSGGNSNRDQNFGNLINDNRSNTQSINDNNDSNTQDVINNQNSNTDKQIESQKVCTQYDKSSIELDNLRILMTGELHPDNNFGTSKYIKISTSSVLKIINHADGDWQNRICFYNVNKSLISCHQFTTDTIVPIPSNSSYFRFSLNKDLNKPQYELCTNGNQAIVDSQQDINNTLNDTSGGEVSSSWFDEFRDSSSTPVSDLLTMPITLLQAYLNGFSGTCQAMNLGQLYGTYIIIPCLNIESYLGHELWSLIDVIFTLFMLYNIGMLCVSIYEGLTSLNDDMQFLYSPRHAGAGDTRVERYGDGY